MSNLQSQITQALPLTVGAICDPESLEKIWGASDCDLLELRLDALGNVLQIRSFAERSRQHVPLLVTARHPDEGGMNDLTSAARESLLRGVWDLADAIDLELRSLAELGSLWEEAGERGLLKIASFHDFSATPSLDLLQSKVAEAAAAGADVAKFAFRIRSAADLQVLIALLEDPAPLPLSVMGMGPLAPSSRLLAAQLGSVLNYGYLGTQASAPGQWPAPLLKQAISASQSGK